MREEIKKFLTRNIDIVKILMSEKAALEEKYTEKAITEMVITDTELTAMMHEIVKAFEGS